MHWGSFDGWRAVHVLSGVLTLAVLVAHTGFRTGENLNFFLMMVFSGLLLAGAVIAQQAAQKNGVLGDTTAAAQGWTMIERGALLIDANMAAHGSTGFQRQNA